MNLNRLYSFSRFFSETRIVLRPSSFAPFRTCNAQCEPRVATETNSNYSNQLGFMNYTIFEETMN